MSHEENAILLRALELTEALIEFEPPKWHTLARDDWQLQMAHGPRYAVGHWFGPQHERDRMRYRRAIDRLEARRLITTFRAWGSRLSHLQLTHDGMAAAEHLREESLPNCGDSGAVPTSGAADPSGEGLDRNAEAYPDPQWGINAP